MPRIEEAYTDIVWSRVDSIIVLILDNERYMQSKRTKELVQIVMEKFAVKERTAYRYLSIAKREIRKIGKEKREKAFLKAIRDREYLLAKTKNTDYKLALEIMKDRDKLYGLYVDEIHHSGAIENKITFVEDIKE